ncbi:MAG: hypothetical protein KAQ81_11335 [Deltaproteobacteria bacterium]|nr:hypothetical protein [Deltaproteobacteria bacterium]
MDYWPPDFFDEAEFTKV